MEHSIRWGHALLVGVLAVSGCGDDGEAAGGDAETTTGEGSGGSESLGSTAGPETTQGSEGSEGADETAGDSTTGGEPDEVPRFEPGACRVSVPEGLGVAVECGDLVVPHDRLDPAAGTISLHVVRLRSPNPQAVAEPLVFLNGGPGQPMAGIVGSLSPQIASLITADRDAIWYDQRGVGTSQPGLGCEGVDPTVEDLDVLVEAIATCRDELLAEGVALHAFRTTESADDLADLRTALDVPALDVFGTSYGTRLGLELMRRHPEAVRAAILDSQVPADLPWVLYMGTNLDSVLTRLFEACAEDPACAAAYPDLELAFSEAVARFDAQPFVPFPGANPIAGRHIVELLFQRMYDREFLPYAPLAIESLRSAPLEDLGDVLGSMGMETTGAEVTVGMHLAFMCNDVMRYVDAEEAHAAVTDAGLRPEVEAWALANLVTYVDGCEGWPTADSGPEFREPVESDIPTLLSGGELDPITPLAWSERVAEGLSHARLAAFAAHGHGPLTASECGASLVLGHLADPWGPLDTSCAQAFTLEFVVP